MPRLTMPSIEKTISEDERWMSLLPESFTCHEAGEAWGISVKAARNRIHLLKASCLIAADRKSRNRTVWEKKHA